MVSEQGFLVLVSPPKENMDSRKGYHYKDIYFDGYDYHAWKTYIFDVFQEMGSDIMHILEHGYSPPLDHLHPTLEEERDSLSQCPSHQ